jgi:DNA-binding MarR family transcriptional regulator
MNLRQHTIEPAAATALMDIDCACATARQVARTLTRLYDSALRTVGIEAAQFALMMVLEIDGASSQVELGRRYLLEKTTVSRNLNLLERNGWIRSSVGSDKRTRQFQLTAKGRKLLAAAKPEWKKAQNRLRSRLPAGQWDEMFRVFRTVTRAAQDLQST